jgi:hypothetical protein
MSRIYFHSEQETAEVKGWERAWAGKLCLDLLRVALQVDKHDREPNPLRRIIPKDSYLSDTKGAEFANALDAWLYSSNHFVVEGHKISPFSASLNTAWAMGSDPMRLMARLHGQCEIHAYVEGPNRAWLADIIEQGREVGIMRSESGWEGVVALLRSRDDGPVVTSYSVCQQFPNEDMVELAGYTWPEDEDGDPDYETFYEMPESERWRLAMTGLRLKADSLEMRPKNWNEFYFNHGVNGFELRAIADRLEREARPANDDMERSILSLFG